MKVIILTTCICAQICVTASSYAQKGGKVFIKDNLSEHVDSTQKEYKERFFIRGLVRQYDILPAQAASIVTLKIDQPGNGRYESVKVYDKANNLIKEISFNKYFEPSVKKDHIFKNNKKAYSLEYSYAPDDGWTLVDSTSNR